MGSSDNFCLRWNDFESNISTSFRELRDDSEFFDVTLCCDNGTDLVQAHKVILAACSPLFRKILAHQKNQQNPLLYLKGIRLKELQAVLNFMYHGEVNVAQDSLNNFLAVAEELAVKGLTTDSQGSSNAPEARKKAVAKRKSLPQSHQSGADRSNSGGGSATKKAKNEDDDDDHGGDGIDIKRIKAEPEPSGSGAHQSSAMEDIGDDSYAGEEGADDFGDGEDFEGFAQYGEGQDFDDSLAGASGSGAGADGKALEEARFTKSQFGKAILVDADGYRYSHSRMNDKRVYWRCVYYMKNRGSCPGKAVTEGFFIRQKSGGHLHKPLEPIVRRPHGNSSQAKKLQQEQQVQQQQQHQQLLQQQQPQQQLPQQQQQQQPQQIHELNTMQQLHHAY